jgi:hypothetical protein
MSEATQRQAPADYGPVSVDLTDLPYAYPVSTVSFVLTGQDVRMAYTDVQPVGTPNGHLTKTCVCSLTPKLSCVGLPREPSRRRGESLTPTSGVTLRYAATAIILRCSPTPKQLLSLVVDVGPLNTRS